MASSTRSQVDEPVHSWPGLIISQQVPPPKTRWPLETLSHCRSLPVHEAEGMMWLPSLGAHSHLREAPGAMLAITPAS